MRKWPLQPFWPILLLFLLPSAASACAEPGIFPAVPWTTHIESITPQAGIAGITYVYVEGYCFGDSPGSITVGGAVVTDIVFWTDYEIEFQLPGNATTGDLVVTASSYGSDDSAKETGCPRSSSEGWPANGYYCGNDMINASFDVLTASTSNPPLCCAPNTSPPAWLVSPVGYPPSAPQYVNGTWYYDDGGILRTFILTQGPQNSDGTWTVTGTETSSLGGGPEPIPFGLLDKQGDLIIETYWTSSCLEYLILGSGDVTSPGYSAGTASPTVPCPAPQSGPGTNFLSSYPVEADEGAFWYFIKPPLFKGQTDLPTDELPTPLPWGLGPSWDNSVNKTYGVWQRQFPSVASGGQLLSEFGGRFVYEQNGSAGATDNCYVTGNPSQYNQQVTGLSGGGWFVTQGGIWEYDDIGMRSQSIDWYQQNQPNLPCHFTMSQDMYIDGRTQTLKYTTNQLEFIIGTNELTSEVQPEGGSVVKTCEYYSNQAVSQKKCTRPQ
jgi:hypothetical protein